MKKKKKNLKYVVNNRSTFRLAPDLFDTKASPPASNYDIESGYTNRTRSIELYPVRVFGTGKEASFVVLLRMFTYDIDRLCGGSSQGFKLSFHSPNESPQIWRRYFHVSPGKTAFFTISPNVINASSSYKSYSPSVRQCFFSHERQLRFYKQYTQRNCELECVANYTVTKCACAEFAMPSNGTIVSVMIVNTIVVNTLKFKF